MRNSSQLQLLLLIASAASATCRVFQSRDAAVSKLISRCLSSDSGLSPPPDLTSCQGTLQCIQSNVDAATAARWSAGASILAFIPTIAAFVSNGIGDLVQIAEESWIVALALASCSITAFEPRPGVRHVEVTTSEAVREKMRAFIKQEQWNHPDDILQRKAIRTTLLVLIMIVLLASCAAIWYPVYQIQKYGVVVFTCPQRVQVPIWIGLMQAVAVVNVLLKPWTVEEHRIPLKVAVPQDKASAAAKTGLWPLIVILSCPKDTTLSTLIYGFTSTLNVALYTYATGVLSAMTMFPASDAIKAMVMLSTAAGVGRIIGSNALVRRGSWRKTISFHVERWQMEDLKRELTEIVRQASLAGV